MGVIHHSEETKRRISEKISRIRKGHKLSQETKDRISKTLKNHPVTKETLEKMSRNRMIDNPSYTAIHGWLNTQFGRPSLCENLKCLGVSRRYEWAKKKECEYGRKRENFIRLCRSCHHEYDEISEKIWKKIRTKSA